MSQDPPRTEKDVGKVPMTFPPTTYFNLQSSEQEIFHKIRDIISNEPVTESKLQFFPDLLILKSI